MREAKIEGLGLEAGWEYEIPVPAVPGTKARVVNMCGGIAPSSRRGIDERGSARPHARHPAAALPGRCG